MIMLVAIIFSSLNSFAAIEAECPGLRNIRRDMSVVADNMANVETTRTPDGGPYKEKVRVCEDGKCKIKRIRNFRAEYQPDHPDADENGLVKFPGYSLQSQSEKMDRLVAAYEATVMACETRH